MFPLFHFLMATGVEPNLQWKYVLYVFLYSSLVSEQNYFTVTLQTLNFTSSVCIDDFGGK